jgi:amino acid transporter
VAETTTQQSTGTRATLGLTALTSNAMALIAPGAFLWLTYAMQSQLGAPLAGQDMWMGILFALFLCFATAISYAELSKLYPGAGSSYFYAEQAFLGKTTHRRFARIAKFVTGWSSHLYYWVYPGVMVAVTAILAGYMVGQIWPTVFNAGLPSPIFMILFSIAFAFGVGYIAFRGVVGSTAVNLAINIIQISALLIFSVIAIAYRVKHPDGAQGFQLNPDGVPTSVVWETEKDKDGNVIPKKEKDKDGKETGNYVTMKGVDGKDKPFLLTYAPDQAMTATDNPDTKQKDYSFQFHRTAGSVVGMHGMNYVIIQACIAILILVGFESVTAMGEEAKNAKRDIPVAVLASLAIQGGFCYLIEYFAANYFLNSGYTQTTASGSAAPIGDMMYIVGAWLFGSPEAGKWFMMIQAFTVFLALIGTTLSCMNTGARVTYAMGRDAEVSQSFGLLHEKHMTPHKSIWTLVVISAIIGIICCIWAFYGPAAPTDDTLKALPKNGWYSMLIPSSHDKAAAIPNSLLALTLVSNFGTFVLYMLTCLTAMIAFKEHHTFREVKHSVIPMFGFVANLICLLFYLVGPFTIENMSPKEPYIALGVAFVWMIYGIFHLRGSSRARNQKILLDHPETPTSPTTPMTMSATPGLGNGNGGQAVPTVPAGPTG